jgi:hypothetical protein
MESKEIILSICVEDVQEVAKEVMGRELCEDELIEVKSRVQSSLDWERAVHDILSDSAYMH